MVRANRRLDNASAAAVCRPAVHRLPKTTPRSSSSSSSSHSSSSHPYAFDAPSVGRHRETVLIPLESGRRSIGEMSRAKVEARKDGAKVQEEAAVKEPKAEIKQRATSNILSIFPQAQIQELKEAFTMIDANRDGFIDSSDLKAIYNSLGQDPTDEQRQKMLSECPGQLNFTAFLTLFGEKLHGTDPETTLRQAFRMFDKEGKGTLEEAYIKDLLSNMGDNFTEDEIRQTWKEAPISGGLFDYNAFVTLMKRGSQDEVN